MAVACQQLTGEREEPVHVDRLVMYRDAERVGRRLDGLRNRDVAGHDGDGDAAPHGIRPKLEQESKASHARHREIEQDGIRLEALVHQAERVFRGHRGHRCVSSEGQRLAEERPDAFFVLDDENRV